MGYDLLLERFLRYVKINTRSDENEGSKTRIRRTRFK